MPTVQFSRNHAFLRIFDAQDTHEDALEALKDEAIQALLEQNNETLKANGNYGYLDTETVLTSADLLRLLADNYVTGHDDDSQHAIEDHRNGNGAGAVVEAYAAELGYDTSVSSYEQALAYLRLAYEDYEGGPLEVARRIIAEASGRREAREALKGLYLAVEPYTTDGNSEIVRDAYEDMDEVPW